MTKVYLDNNILVSIEERGLNFQKIKNFFQNDALFVFSYVHIQELMESKSNLTELIDRRVRTIIETTNLNYVFPKVNTIELTLNNPVNVINDIKKCQLLTNTLRINASSFSINRDFFISLLGIDVLRINNYNSLEVVDHINLLLNKKGALGFENIINLAGGNIHEKICSVFNFLDLIGYWKDSKNEKSNLARMYDASHSFMASGCDFFISEDKRAINKAKVAFDLFKINTKVLSLKEILS